jgi:glycosyltransferase involved in cell wall biosynthesis
MSKTSPSISVFFPFLNDWGTVGSLIGLAAATVAKITDDWEIIIVNDGSRKEDREALGMIINATMQQPACRQGRCNNATMRGKIKIIDHEKNRGYGGALRSGFTACKKDLIFYTDCDAQYDPRELTILYEAMKPEIDMVNGYKIKRNDPWYRTLSGRIYHHLVCFAFDLPIKDTDCDFRLIRRKVFDPSTGLQRVQSSRSGQAKVKLFENTGTICVELVKKIDYHGYKIAQVPVHHFFRTSGKSQFFNFGRLYKTGTNLVKLWWKLMVLKKYDE